MLGICFFSTAGDLVDPGGQQKVTLEIGDSCKP